MDLYGDQFGSVGLGLILFSLFASVIGYVVVALLLAKVFAQAGAAPWRAWVPFLNAMTFLNLGGYAGWWVFVGFIPFVGSVILLVIAILATVNVNQGFGKSGWFVVLAIFLPVVWLAIIAFGGASWRGLPATVAVKTYATPKGETAQSGYVPFSQFAPEPASPSASVPVAPVQTPVSPSESPEVPSSSYQVPPTPAGDQFAQTQQDSWFDISQPSQIPGYTPPSPTTLEPVSPPPEFPPAGVQHEPVIQDAVSEPVVMSEPAVAPEPAATGEESPFASAFLGELVNDLPSSVDELDDDFDETQIVAKKRKIGKLILQDGQQIDVTETSVVIGRNPRGAQDALGGQIVRVIDPEKTVSKTHAKLEYLDGTWYITDLNSTNGVMLFADGTETEIPQSERVKLTGKFKIGEFEVVLADS